MKYIIQLFFLSTVLFIQGCATKPSIDDAEIEEVSRSITVQGQATINKGKLLARKQAFRSAIRNISAQTSGQVSSEAILGSTKVVDEWVVGNVYYVQVLAVLSPSSSGTSSDLVCNSPYRKRIIATGFPGVVSGQISANETQDLYSGIPREMMNILMESGNFVGKNETHTVLYSRPDMAPEIFDETGYQDSIVVQMAQGQGAQFVLSGVIRDFEVESTEYIRGAGLFSQMKAMMRDFVARRGIAIDVYMHDGLTGSLLFQHRYTDTVIGDVWIPTGYTVGSERFKSTPSGHKISKIIKLASKDIGRLFSCYPFSSKVIKVENNKVYIDAGAQNKLKRGDSLVVYGIRGSSAMPEDEQVGVIKIQSVQANFSIGAMELASDARKIKAGDLVKSW